MRWIEADGPPVTPPTHRGFSTRIMENIIAGQLRGEVRFDWRDHGLTCEIALLIAQPCAGTCGATAEVRGHGAMSDLNPQCAAKRTSAGAAKRRSVAR